MRNPFKIFSIIFIFLFLSTKTESKGQDVSPMIALNQLSLDVDTINQQFSPLDSLVEGYEIYCVGESHTVISNPKLHFNLFVYLYHQAGVRYYVMEGNYTYVYFINQYVQTGNEEYLVKAENSIKMLDDYYRRGITLPVEYISAENKLDSSYNQISKAFYLFNSTLPEQEKIKIISADTELFYDASLLEDIMPKDGQIPEEIKSSVEELLKIKRTEFGKANRMDMKGQGEQDIIKVVKRARINFQQNTGIYRDYFKDDFSVFDHWLNNKASFNRSEKNIYRNFMGITENFKKGGYFFRYGCLHTRFQNGWLSWLLENKSPYEGKVINFLPQYMNCEHLFNNPVTLESSGVLKSKYNSRIPKNQREIILDELIQSTNKNFSFYDLSATGYDDLKKLGQVFILIQNQQYRNY